MLSHSRDRAYLTLTPLEFPWLPTPAHEQNPAPDGDGRGGQGAAPHTAEIPPLGLVPCVGQRALPPGCSLATGLGRSAATGAHAVKAVHWVNGGSPRTTPHSPSNLQVD